MKGRVPFFSVIVPMHNAEEWVRTGLESIRRQTFKDYELIAVCDDCRDRTAEIAREYTENVTEVSWRNRGKARNTGLEKARGRWILWMDDDDWWHDDMAFRKIAEEILDDEELDILAFNFVFKYHGIARQYPGHLYIAVWNKAWRRDFIGETRFPEIEHTEDVRFARETHGKARIRYLDEVLYYYNYMRPGSYSAMKAAGELAPVEV